MAPTPETNLCTASLKKHSRSFFRFDAEVDWHQRHEFLKFEVPLNIKNDFATYETQFGHVQRPTHKNTTWDMAKFEVCGHKVSIPHVYGRGGLPINVTVISTRISASTGTASPSCRNLSMVSLAAATCCAFPCCARPQPPTPNKIKVRWFLSFDERQCSGRLPGKHEFSWAVMPHQGSFLESDVPIAATLFNSPLHGWFHSSHYAGCAPLTTWRSSSRRGHR